MKPIQESMESVGVLGSNPGECGLLVQRSRSQSFSNRASTHMGDRSVKFAHGKIFTPLKLLCLSRVEVGAI